MLSMDTLSKQIEKNNKNSILRCIERWGEISRADVAKQLGLSRTTVSTAVTQLMEAGLVREAVQSGGPQNRGRPGIPLSLTSDRWYAVGAAFIDGELLFVLTDLQGTVTDRLHLPVVPPTAEVFLRVLAEGFAALIARCPGRLLPMLGIGSPGMVDHDGRILRATDMDWENVPIARHLEQTLGYPSVVVNRHWASCLSEYRFGAGRNIQNQIYVGISTGIAASIILDGRLITGAYHSAGEIGHTVVDREGPVCSCGRRGCLHAVASENALLAHARQHYAAHPGPVCPNDTLWAALQSGRALNIEDICRAADGDNPMAQGELATAALYLGLSIGNLISMFNTQRVVLGGSLIDHGGPRFTRQIIESVHKHISADLVVDVQPWQLGPYSSSLGAALLVLDQKLDLASR